MVQEKPPGVHKKKNFHVPERKKKENG